uniref:Ycf66 family protein n=1 Tax=Tetraselmis sp. GSL018 TaxID=582737 RepID=A0A061QUA0_9CHLO|mmetsp:Transcript_15774/g.37443  ORF Transcript_15774/g.37443 Transcript_15774/m.37443 type:complete len:278 (-) Transcript_15774:38-871(-)
MHNSCIFAKTSTDSCCRVISSAAMRPQQARPGLGKLYVHIGRTWSSRRLSVRNVHLKSKATKVCTRRSYATTAMVNVDLGPSTLLGSGLILGGLVLWQMRSSRPELSRDMDVVLSSMGVLVGGILIFQGWRLDPLLLFGQLLTVTAAVTFAAEAISLRKQVIEQEMRDPTGLPEREESRDATAKPLPPPSARSADFGERFSGSFEDRWEDRWSQGSFREPQYSDTYEGYYDAGGRDARSAPPREQWGAESARERRSPASRARGTRSTDVDLLDDWGA